MMRTSNPTLTDRAFQQAGTAVAGEVMTVQGAVQKTAVLLAIAVATASWAWTRGWSPGQLAGIVIASALAAFVVAMLTALKSAWSPVTAPCYAALEGIALGGISLIFETKYPGIVPQAVGLTFGTLFALLGAYQSGLIRATENFKLGVTAATGGIALIYLATWILGFFGIRVPYIHESGLAGILFSLFVVVIAALNLVLDFDFIERGAERHAPKFMEWYAAFGLLVTLVWLYLEFLRLLAKARERK